jgi:lysophospholipase L1-like esterase
MNIHISVIFSLLIFASSVAVSQQLMIHNNDIIVCLGNSITELGEQPDGYVSVMRKALHLLCPDKVFVIINSGISGHKSTDMSARFESDVLEYKPNWVTISVGINDVWHGFYDDHPQGDGPRGVPLPLFEEKLTDMIQRAIANKIRVALFTTTIIKEDLSSPENKKLEAYNNKIRELAKKYNCLLVDQNKAFRSKLLPKQKPGMSISGRLTKDGVHMLPAGNWLMARTTLSAFGVSAASFDRMKPQIDSLIHAEEKREATSPARGK